MQPLHDPSEDRIGTVVDDRYRIEALIGQGGQATVYLVQHLKLGSRHAMKVVEAKPAARARILQEGQVQASLEHPHVVRVTDVVELDRGLGLIMEYVKGPDLAQVIQHRKLTLEQVDGVAKAMLAAMVAAHELGLVHRDLKPENVLMSEGPMGVVPKVSDFGLVLKVDAPSRHTPTGAVLGTPYYMSPEQIKGRTVDHRSDLWAIGAILYELLSGRLAFDGHDLLEILNKVDQAAPAPLDPSLPPRMLRTIERALSHDPAARFADAREMLASWEGDEQTIQPTRETRIFGLDLSVVGDDGRPTSPQNSWRPSSVQTGVAMGIGLAGILAVGFGSALALAAVAIGLGFGRSASPPVAEATEPLEAPASVPATEPNEVLEAFVDGGDDPVEAAQELPPPPPVEQGSGDVRVVTRVGRVIVTGARVALKRDGKLLEVPAKAPIGDYEVFVAFGAQPSFLYPRLLTVEEDAVHEIRCNPQTQLCNYFVEGR